MLILVTMQAEWHQILSYFCFILMSLVNNKLIFDFDSPCPQNGGCNLL